MEEPSAMGPAIDVREAGVDNIADQTSLIQDLMMKSDQKDIRLKEMSEQDIRGVMDEINQNQIGSPFDMMQNTESP